MRMRAILATIRHPANLAVGPLLEAREKASLSRFGGKTTTRGVHAVPTLRGERWDRFARACSKTATEPRGPRSQVEPLHWFESSRYACCSHRGGWTRRLFRGFARKGWTFTGSLARRLSSFHQTQQWPFVSRR